MKTSFLTTLLWSSTSDNGNPLDSIYSISDIDNLSIIDRVIERFTALVESDPILISIENISDLTGNSSDRIAHDLCLTINRHGAGFWDGDYGYVGIGSIEYGDRLTEIAQSFTEIGLYENNSDRLTIEQY